MVSLVTAKFQWSCRVSEEENKTGKPNRMLCTIQYSNYFFEEIILY